MAKPTIIEDFIPCTSRWGVRVQDESCFGYGKTILFIDRKYAKNDGGDWDKGQPTYSYGIDTIAAHKKEVPLCLDLATDWIVDASAMNVAIEIAKNYKD